jgi:hypothetical protein
MVVKFVLSSTGLQNGVICHQNIPSVFGTHEEIGGSIVSLYTSNLVYSKVHHCTGTEAL